MTIGFHKSVSFIKSSIRIAACAFALFGSFEAGFGGLLLAEVLGIVEELYEDN